jgi:leucyl-tRNA synthetase
MKEIVYNPAEIEKKWRQWWDKNGIYKFDIDNNKPKFYNLSMFSYPSGDKLHIGHWYNYGPADTFARYKRLKGFNVFEPMGFDAFGLPAENYAIEHSMHPAKSTKSNITFMEKQLKEIGAMFDWEYEIDTSDPLYYKWTQWIFLKMYELGLAYQKEAPVNWCPECQTVLANEQVTAQGECDRCGAKVIKKNLKQWFLKITKYADRLLEGLNRVNWPEKTKIMQRNWIGRSEGALVKFPVEGKDFNLEVFTTRPDTLFGVSYCVIAPEHKIVDKLTTKEQRDAVNRYVEKTLLENEIERQSTEHEKTGVFTGGYAINPVNDKKIPIWIADYVIAHYGTGMVMAVPAHDSRDFVFAKKFDLPVIVVIQPQNEILTPLSMENAYIEQGTMINSGRFNDMKSEEFKKVIVDYLEENEYGKRYVNYRLRDWLISRQRYWGAPIPIIHCPECGIVPVDTGDIPVKLPDIADFKPKGKSPLASVPEFMNVKCPKCGSNAMRDPDTMDTFVCSSWYYLRYPDPKIETYPFNKKVVNKLLPVDQYIGGAEHAIMHLLYARFVTKALFDAGEINFDEPFTNLFHQGTITRNGAKMSKSRGNAINPDEFINKYGSDTFRMYLMFSGSYEEGGEWDDSGINGIFRFLSRVYHFYHKHYPKTGTTYVIDKNFEKRLHYTIKRVSTDIERFSFNTAIARMMEFINDAKDFVKKNIDTKGTSDKVIFKGKSDENNPDSLKESLDKFLILIAPFAPHLAEELWYSTGRNDSIFNELWPDYNEDILKEDIITIAIQINGKLRSTVEIETNITEEDVKDIVLNNEKIKLYIENKKIKRFIYIKGKIANIVI